MIVGQGNDYLVGVKANQSKLMKAIQQAEQQHSPISQDQQIERSRDRVVERTVSVYAPTAALAPAWSHAQSLIVVRRCGTRTRKPFDRVSYYLSSLRADALALGLGIRGHRLIENGLHWVKDVVFGEDDAPFVQHTPATNWSVIRNFVINLFRQHGYYKITKAQRLLKHDLDALFGLMTTN